MNFPYSTKKWMKLGMAAFLTTAIGVGTLTASANTTENAVNANNEAATETPQSDAPATAEGTDTAEEQAAADEETSAAQPTAVENTSPANTANTPAANNSATSAAVEDLTLERAIEQALETNVTLENARLNKKNADINYRLSYPTPAKMPEEAIETLSAAQAKYVQQETQDLNKKLNELNLAVTESKIKLGAQQQYYDLVYAMDDLELKKKSLARAQAQLKVAQAAFDVGTKAKTDVLQAEMGVASAQAALVSAESALEIARMNLNDFLGVDLNKKWNIVPEHKQTAKITKTLEQAQQEALSKRVELVQAEGELQLAEVNVQVIEKYSALSTYQGRIARNNVETAKLAIEEQKRAVSKEVAQAYFNLNSALQAIEFQKKAMESAAESYRLTNLRYENGLATTLEVIQAEEELANRENQYQRAIQTYNLAVVNFDTALGN